MIKSLILSNSNNLLLLAYSISSANSLYIVKNLQKRALPSLNNDYSGLYEELFKKPGKTTANVSNYCTLFIEIFKNSQKYQSWFCKGNCKLRMTNSLTWKKHQLNLGIPKSNQGIFGKKVWGTFAQNFHALRHTI